MQVLGYVRVSQVRGRSGDSFISPDTQAEQIHDWARANDAQVVEVLTELDESGSRRDRPMLERCVEAIERGEVDGMVVAKLDRYFRDQLGGHTMMARIKDARGFLAVPGDGLDTRFEAGKMLFGFLLTIAEGELDRYRRQFADARARAVARGVHPSPVPPFGYRRNTDSNGQMTGRLLPRPETAPLVRELFRRRANREGLAVLARWLERERARTAYNGEGWTSRSVKGVIRNRVYLGEARHGQFVNPDAHEPLTDELAWRRAQQPGRAVAGRGKRPALLAGLLRCAGCRYGMRTYINRHGKREYACHRRHAGGMCLEPASTSNARLEQLVIERFFHELGDVALRPADDVDAYEEARRRRDQAEADLVSYRDSVDILRELGPERFAAGLAPLRRTVDEAERALDAATPRTADLDATGLRDRWDGLDVVEQRQLLRLVINAVFLRRGRDVPISQRVHFCFRGDAPQLPVIGGKPAVAPVPFRFPVAHPPSAGVATLEHLGEGSGDVIAD